MILPKKTILLTKLKLFLWEVKEARSCFLVVVCFCVLGFLPAAIAFPFFVSMNKFEELAITVWVVSVGISNSSANSVIFFGPKQCQRKKLLRCSMPDDLSHSRHYANSEKKHSILQNIEYVKTDIYQP